jgi:type I restriction enzyme S subunit
LLLSGYDEQIKAGDLLYLLNQKIEVNNRTNTKLEAMAKTL